MTPTITVTVGPMSCWFGNANKAMNLRPHHHHAEVSITYEVAPGEHGYPSFLSTNDALRAHLKALCSKLFTDATNEDVTTRLLDGFRDFAHPSWHQYGGRYAVRALSLDVYSNDDAIGHDNGHTLYRATLPDEELVWISPAEGEGFTFTPNPTGVITINNVAATNPVAAQQELDLKKRVLHGMQGHLA